MTVQYDRWRRRGKEGHTRCEPMSVASAREPVPYEATAHPPNDPPNGDDGRQHGGIDVGPQAKNTRIEGGMPADLYTNEVYGRLGLALAAVSM